MEVSKIDYRVENKYIVSNSDIVVLSRRLQTIMQKDAHQKEGNYEVRSVYFDDFYNSCVEENETGIDGRKKYRIRMYNSSSKVLNLEIKEKKNGFTRKNICRITPEEYNILSGKEGMIPFGNRTPLNELILQKKCMHICPKLIVTYERTAYIHSTGNVRITFDRNIMASKFYNTFLEEKVLGLVPILPIGMHVLEVKYDEVLPFTIAEQLEIGKLRQTAFSKYYLGRKAVIGAFSNVV